MYICMYDSLLIWRYRWWRFCCRTHHWYSSAVSISGYRRRFAPV